MLWNSEPFLGGFLFSQLMQQMLYLRQDELVHRQFDGFR